MHRARHHESRLIRMSWALGAAALLLGGAGVARAKMSGDQVIAKMDEAMTRAKDQRFIYELKTKEPGKSPRTMKIEVHIKGESWRRIDFLAPGDVKGMKVLIRSHSQMYTYLPAYRKIRRVASHVKDQGFMGTAYSHDEMSIVTYGDVFKGKLVKEDEETWTVEARRRKGQEFIYPRLLFVIDKKYLQPREVRYFNGKGANVKTETRTDYACKGNICNAKVMKMTDHTRNDTWTRFDQKAWEVNTGVSDRFFSVRALQRRR